MYQESARDELVQGYIQGSKGAERSTRCDEVPLVGVGPCTTG